MTSVTEGATGGIRRAFLWQPESPCRSGSRSVDARRHRDRYTADGSRSVRHRPPPSSEEIPGWGAGLRPSKAGVTMAVDEREGGDPPCWAHLVDETAEPGGACEVADTGGLPDVRPDEGGAIVADLAALARAATAEGAAWTHQSDDLNVNLLVFGAGGGVSEHLNAEVDVLLVGIAGEGIVAVDGTPYPLRAGHVLVIPKGARRGTRATSPSFAYLSCHRRRAGLWPNR